MTERPDPPTDSGRAAGDAPQDTGWQRAGWRGIGPGRIERGITLDEPAAHELFFELLERIARLSGFPAETRVHGAEVVIRGTRNRAAQEDREPEGAQRLELVLRLDLDRSEP